MKIKDKRNFSTIRYFIEIMSSLNTCDNASIVMNFVIEQTLLVFVTLLATTIAIVNGFYIYGGISITILIDVLIFYLIKANNKIKVYKKMISELYLANDEVELEVIFQKYNLYKNIGEYMSIIQFDERKRFCDLYNSIKDYIILSQQYSYVKYKTVFEISFCENGKYAIDFIDKYGIHTVQYFNNIRVCKDDADEDNYIEFNNSKINLHINKTDYKYNAA